MEWTIDSPVFEDGSLHARIVAWHREIGALVKMDEVVLEIETQKSVLEVIAPRDGYLVAKSAVIGEIVQPKQTLATFSDSKPR